MKVVYGEKARSSTRCGTAVRKGGELRFLSRLGRTLYAISWQSGSDVFRLREAAQ